MKNRYVKTVAAVLAVSAAIIPILTAAPVYADNFGNVANYGDEISVQGGVNMDDIREVKISEDGNWFKEGGMNRYDGTEVTSEQEAQEMETRLKAENYIEINDLTPEQYEAFVTNDKVTWWFEEYIKPADDMYAEFYNGWYKIYVFEPSFIDWWEDYQESEAEALRADSVPKMEIDSSSVVINYRVFWAKERVGKDLSEELNEGVPSWHKAGYITITSPIDAEIKFFLKDEQNYYTIYLRGGIPFRAKMKSGNYSITEINGQKIDTYDKNMTNGNTLDIGWEDVPSLETPFEVDITKAVEAYNIKSIDLTGKPDRSLDKNQKLASDDKTIVKEDPEDTEDVIRANKPNWFKRILIGVIIAALCAGVGAYIYLDRKRRR